MSGQTEIGRDTDEYRSLSPLAAVALILGLLSPTALVTPLLLVVPASAAGAALLALAKIRSSDRAQTGARMAQWGLALAVVFGVATFVRDPVRAALMRRQTATLARDWLTLLAEGRIDDSLRLVGSRAIQSLGPPQGDPSAEPPKAEDVMVIVRSKMQSDSVAERVAKLKPPLVVTELPGSSSAPIADGTRIMLSQDFLVRGDQSSQSCRVQLQFTRLPAYEAEGRPWRIDSWQLLEEPSHSDSSDNETEHQAEAAQ